MELQKNGGPPKLVLSSVRSSDGKWSSKIKTELKTSLLWSSVFFTIFTVKHERKSKYGGPILIKKNGA